MRWNLSTWLREHRAEVELRWLEVCPQMPAYAEFAPQDRLSCWDSLIEALTAGDKAARTEMAGSGLTGGYPKEAPRCRSFSLSQKDSLRQFMTSSQRRRSRARVWRAAYGLITALAGALYR